MLESMILWIILNGQPKALGHYDVPKGTSISVMRDYATINNCESAALVLRSYGIKAWCVPHVAI